MSRSAASQRLGVPPAARDERLSRGIRWPRDARAHGTGRPSNGTVPPSRFIFSIEQRRQVLVGWHGHVRRNAIVEPAHPIPPLDLQPRVGEITHDVLEQVGRGQDAEFVDVHAAGESSKRADPIPTKTGPHRQRMAIAERHRETATGAQLHRRFDCRHQAVLLGEANGLGALTAANVKHRHSGPDARRELARDQLLSNRVAQIPEPTDPDLFTRPQRSHGSPSSHPATVGRRRQLRARSGHARGPEICARGASEVRSLTEIARPIPDVGDPAI